MGDRPLTHSKNLTEFLDQYGVVAPNRAEFQEINKGLNQTVEVQNAEHLFRPLTVPAAHFRCTVGASVGLYSVVRCRFTSGSGGGYITHAKPISGTVRVSTNTQITFTPGAAQFPSIICTDQAKWNWADYLEVLPGTAAAISPYITPVVAGIVYEGCPFWIAENAEFWFVASAVNAAISISVGMQAVP